MSAFFPNTPSGGQSGCLAYAKPLQHVHLYSNSKKSMTCLGWRFAVSSIMWCPTWISWSAAPHWLQVFFFSGDLTMSGVLGLGRVVPLWPLGLPGKRLVLFVWSPVRVGYMRFEDGVCGFSYRIRLRLRVSSSFLRARFSSVSCWIFWQFWQVWSVMQVM